MSKSTLKFETYTPIRSVDKVKNYDDDVITNVFVPDATTIQQREFAYGSIHRIVAPSVQIVKAEAFLDSLLRAVIMPNVTTIQEGAFSSCPSLSYIFAPNLIDGDIEENVKIIAPKLRRGSRVLGKKRARELVDSIIKLRF